MIINKKTLRKNKAVKRIQKDDRKTNRDRRLERGCSLKKNIGKIVKLSTQEPIGAPAEASGSREETAGGAGEISAEKLIESVQAAGLTGMSGSGFPVADKLRAFLQGTAETGRKIILINGAECEPSLLHDAWLMRNKKEEIKRGVLYLKKAFAPDKAVLAVRGKMEAPFEPEDDAAEIARVALRYPMGEEHKLIEHALGIKYDKTVIPVNEGIMVTNVQTVYQIGRIMDGTFDGGHFVTLADMKTGEARVAYVDESSDIVQTLQQAFGKNQAGAADADGEAVYAGGGAFRVDKVEAGDKFTMTTAFAATGANIVVDNDNKCRKCGCCTRGCPSGVSVRDIVLALDNEEEADVSQWAPDKCITCGTCTYFCVAGKDPMSYVAKFL